jgi:acyl carrier protein phosphodiesterase
MIANLYGDFVKGRDYSYLPDIVQEGVKLHREIDDFIDHHPLVTDLRLSLYEDLPKIAGIAIDLYFDHLLAKNWLDYSSTPLEKFTERFFAYALDESNLVIANGIENFTYPPYFRDLIKIMHRKNWLTRYEKIEGIEMASTGLSKRISFNNNLHTAPVVFSKHQERIETVFSFFMKDAKNLFIH